MKFLYRTGDYAFIISAMGKLFVTVFAFASAFKTNLQLFLHPDTRLCKQFKTCTVTNFLLRDKLYRDTAPVPPTKIVYRDSLLTSINIVPRPRQNAIKFVPGLQKHVPYPPCTGTTSRLKYQDSGQMLRRVTQPPHIAVPLVAMFVVS